MHNFSLFQFIETFLLSELVNITSQESTTKPRMILTSHILYRLTYDCNNHKLFQTILAQHPNNKYHGCIEQSTFSQSEQDADASFVSEGTASLYGRENFHAHCSQMRAVHLLKSWNPSITMSYMFPLTSLHHSISALSVDFNSNSCTNRIEQQENTHQKFLTHKHT